MGIGFNYLFFFDIRFWGINLSSWILGKLINLVCYLFIFFYDIDRDDKDGGICCGDKVAIGYLFEGG